jgi:hypothetical protein
MTWGTAKGVSSGGPDARVAASASPTRFAAVGEILRRGRGVFITQMGQQEVPAGTDPPPRMVLAPKLAQFAREYPDVLLELTTTEESRLDLVGAGFDHSCPGVGQMQRHRHCPRLR